MNIMSSLAIIALAALIHASFQLSVSVLTLLGGHAIGTKKSHARVLRLITSFVFGAGVMTMLLLSFISLVMLSLFGADAPAIIWAIGCGLLFGVGVAVWMFYYRHEKGTGLWIPRPVASYLHDRTKATQRSAEAFGLGLVSVIGELIFIIAPLTISALVLIRLSPVWQLAGISLYAIISLLGLTIVWVLIGSGHKLSAIQQWRESNKYFLQFVAGSGLVILGFYVYVVEVLGSTVGGV
ncbi:MAG: hypothetical protein ABI716_03060 [Candidatus Saccharibacteria bacterium]